MTGAEHAALEAMKKGFAVPSLITLVVSGIALIAYAIYEERK